MIEVLKWKFIVHVSRRQIWTTWVVSRLMKTCWMLQTWFRERKCISLIITNGERFETYIIKGERGSGKICLNGAAARKVQPDDIVIIMSYALMDFEEAKSFKPAVIFPDPATNKVVK